MCGQSQTGIRAEDSEPKWGKKGPEIDRIDSIDRKTTITNQPLLGELGASLKDHHRHHQSLSFKEVKGGEGGIGFQFKAKFT